MLSFQIATISLKGWAAHDIHKDGLDKAAAEEFWKMTSANDCAEKVSSHQSFAMNTISSEDDDEG